MFNYDLNKKAWMKSVVFKNYPVSLNSQVRRKNRKILLLNKNCVSHLRYKLCTNQYQISISFCHYNKHFKAFGSGNY